MGIFQYTLGIAIIILLVCLHLRQEAKMFLALKEEIEARHVLLKALNQELSDLLRELVEERVRLIATTQEK